MVSRLLESGVRRKRSIGGAIPSIIFHATLILIAVRATAKATTYVNQHSSDVYRVYLPQSPHSEPSSGGAPKSATPSKAPSVSSKPAPAPSLPSIPTNIPPISTAVVGAVVTSDPGTSTVVGAGDFQGGGVGSGGFGNGHGIGGGGAGSGVYSGNEVDRAAYLAKDNPIPPYPETLRQAGIQGNVVLQFIVDTTGRVEPKSVVVKASDNTMFTTSVLTTLRKMRFVPAEAAGRRVRQLVEQPFTFNLK